MNKDFINAAIEKIFKLEIHFYTIQKERFTLDILYENFKNINL